MATAADALEQARQLQQAGETGRAEQVYRQLLADDPAHRAAWYALGTLLDGRGRLDEAGRCFEHCVQLAPADVSGHYQLGCLRLRRRDLEAAATAFRECLRLQPDHAEAMINLGFVLAEQGQKEEALAVNRRAVQLAPQYPQLHNNLGNLLRDRGEYVQAIASYREALRLRPDYANAMLNLGSALASTGQLDEGVGQVRRAIHLQPGNSMGYSSLGAILSTQGRHEEAMALYRRALELNPDHAEAHQNLAVARLLHGDFEHGWPEYEWRWRCTQKLPPFSQPRWDGSPLAGRTILLLSEQGLGDTFQFIRYAALVKARGGTVVVQCQKPLARILERCSGVDRVVPVGAPLPAFDVYAPLMSLPALFGTTLGTVPASVPYLFGAPELIAAWRERLAPVRGFRVGIAWQGNPRFPWDRFRSVPLSHFEPLARVPGVRLLSLQRGPGSEQVAAVKDRFAVISPGEQLDQESGPFMDTAALLCNLDLVISSDTAVAHLAAALGRPVWVALHAAADWRWLLNRDDSPWYPTVRLFRQSRLDHWADVFQRLAEELRKLVDATTRPAPLLVEVTPGELLDRIAALRVEARRRPDPVVEQRLASLSALQDRQLPPSEEATRLLAELEAVREKLVEVEEALGECARQLGSGPQFLHLARSAHELGQQRAGLIGQLNEWFASRSSQKPC